ncbi:MAG TPA: hypothetical protein VFW30_13640 [Bryocella sp.]|nr:hypothetical protein [Bryocella sp.]
MSSPTITLEVSPAKTLRTAVATYFYFFMSLLIAAVVIYGFSHTVDRFLIHAVPVRPWILYMHGIVFSGWVLFFIVQSALVRVRRVRLHRTVGWFGVGLGTIIPVLGLSTAITMDRFDLVHFHALRASPFLAIQLNDVICFAVLFALAIAWRKKSELHRRLILMASCVLTSAAFARFPFVPLHMTYWCVDSLILLGILRDLLVNRRVHRAYLYALPMLMITQNTALHLYFAAPRGWVRITDAILR